MLLIGKNFFFLGAEGVTEYLSLYLMLYGKNFFLKFLNLPIFLNLPDIGFSLSLHLFLAIRGITRSSSFFFIIVPNKEIKIEKICFYRSVNELRRRFCLD